MSERPLHTAELGPREWWACSEPERPISGGCLYDTRCPRCAIKATADAVRQPDRVVVIEGTSQNVPLRDCLVEFSS